MTIRYYVICVLIVAFIAIAVIAYIMDKKDFNNGKCRECGGDLELFDIDSQGGRGYKCPRCNTYLWISYKVDKDYKNIRRP